jgi:hypothetical protein
MKNIQSLIWRGLAAATLGLGMSLVLAAPPAPGTWQRIDNPGPVTGLDGKKHSAQCSGYPGTDPSFRFWARKGSSKNVFVFFEGGGACWDNLTCTFPIAGLPEQVPQFFVPQISPATDPATFDGIFRTDNPANPVHDWSMVYIPYCTGDIHTGSTSKAYTSVGHPVLPVPPGTPITINHRGFDNFMVVLDWMRKNIDKPKNVLVTGASAGGYGATVNSPWVGKAFPQAHLYVVADASQGVTTPAWDQGNPGLGSWNPQLAPWVFGTTLPPGREFMRRAAEGQPHAKMAQFTTSSDTVQIGFYGVMKQFYGPGGACPNPAVDWYQQMSRQLIADGSEVGNYRYYVAGGTYHTLLRSPTFYTEASPGPTFAQWLDDMLDNRGGTRGQGGRWFNASCPTCLIDWPCQ